MPVLPLRPAARRHALERAAQFALATLLASLLIMLVQGASTDRVVVDGRLLGFVAVGVVVWGLVAAVVMEGPAHRRALREAEPLPDGARLGTPPPSGIVLDPKLLGVTVSALFVLDVLLSGEQDPLLRWPGLLATVVAGRIAYELVVHPAQITRAEKERGAPLWVAGEDGPLRYGALQPAAGRSVL